MDSDKNCPCKCRYCLVYEFGFYFMNSTWLLIMIVALIAYFQEVKAYFDRRLVAIDSRRIAGNGSQEAGSIIPAAGSEPVSQLMISPMPKAPGPAKPEASIRSPMKPMITPAKVTQTGNSIVVEMTPQAAQPAPAKDKFALPKGKKSPNELKKVDSTGSDYYDQMLAGKKPVASISQYLLMQQQAKNQKNKEDRKDRKKEERSPMNADDRDRRKDDKRKAKGKKAKDKLHKKTK